MITSFGLLISFIVILFAGFIQGMTSFGFSLVSLPILSIFIPLKIIVPLMILLSLVLNIMIFINLRKSSALKSIALLVIIAIIFTPIGVKLLLILNENILKIVIGIVVTIAAIAIFYEYKIPIKNEKMAHVFIGILGGLLNGSVGLTGPPILLFLKNQGTEKQTFRANLTTFFLLLNITGIISYIYTGVITKDVFRYSIYMLPAVIIGVFAGIKIGNKINEEVFKKLTNILILLMGILSIISGIRM